MVPHESGCVSLYSTHNETVVCTSHLHSEWKKPTYFYILADPRGGVDMVCCAEVTDVSHAVFELIWSVCTPDALICSLGKLFTDDEELHLS